MTGGGELAGRPGLEAWLRHPPELNLLSRPESGVTGFNTREADGLVQTVRLDVD